MSGVIDYYAFSNLFEGQQLFLDTDRIEALVRLCEKPAIVSVRVKVEEIYRSDDLHVKIGDIVLAHQGELYNLYNKKLLAGILKKRYPNGITAQDLVIGKKYLDLERLIELTYKGLKESNGNHIFTDMNGLVYEISGNIIRKKILPFKLED